MLAEVKPTTVWFSYVDFTNDLIDNGAHQTARDQARRDSLAGKLTIQTELGVTMKLKLSGRIRPGTCLLLIRGGKHEKSKV